MKSHQKPFFVLMVIVLLVGMVGLQPPKPVQAVSLDVRISQVYGAGGNSGAAYKNDFIELFNAGTTAVSLDGWSVQYASSGGAQWSYITDLSGTIQPGKYYLIQEDAGNGGTLDLPAPDATGEISMSANSGKVALVNSTTPLTGYCEGSGIIDFVGYGTGTNCSEGSGPTPPTGSAGNSVSRKEAGCQDTDDNYTDFEAGPANPRNSGSSTHSCGSTEILSSDLFISEYIEGSSFNKALEIYNGTGADVDLSAYKVELYSNGASSPSASATLSGTLAHTDVFVLAHADANDDIKAVADLINSNVANWNGDDAIALRKVADGSAVDVFGQIGFDPGSYWALTLLQLPTTP